LVCHGGEYVKPRATRKADSGLLGDRQLPDFVTLKETVRPIPVRR